MQISKPTLIEKCPHCREDHDVVFYRFYPPVPDLSGVVWAWLGFCPRNDKPILNRWDNDSRKEIVKA